MLGRIKEILWGTPTAVIILLVGAYFTFALLRRGAFGKKSVVAAFRSTGAEAVTVYHRFRRLQRHLAVRSA